MQPCRLQEVRLSLVRSKQPAFTVRAPRTSPEPSTASLRRCASPCTRWISRHSAIRSTLTTGSDPWLGQLQGSARNGAWR